MRTKMMTGCLVQSKYSTLIMLQSCNDKFRMLDSLDYTVGMYTKSWAEKANAVIFTMTGLLDENNRLQIFMYVL